MISIIKGDITGLDFDLIVNDARKDLMPQAGICQEIFSKADDGLLEECKQIGRGNVGEVILTHSHGLPCKGILHAIAPLCIDGNQKEMDALEACYWNALAFAYKLCRETGWTSLSIAFPCIGIHNGFHKKDACKVAIRTVKDLFRQYPEASFINVVFVCDTQQNYMIYKEALSR